MLKWIIGIGCLFNKKCRIPKIGGQQFPTINTDSPLDLVFLRIIVRDPPFFVHSEIILT